LQIEVDEHREVAARQAVAVPTRFQRAAAAEEFDHRDVGELHVGRRHTDLHHRAGEVPGEERLLQHLRAADRFDAHVGAVPAGQFFDARDRVFLRRVDRVRRAEVLRPLEFSRVEIDRDDRACAGELRGRDRGVADTATSEHRNGVATGHRTGVGRGAEARHHATTEQSGRFRFRGRVDRRGLSRGHECLLRECTDAERRCEFGAIGERHLLRRVERAEAVPRLALPARPAVAAHRSPVQHDEVARRDVGHVVTDGFDHPRRFVSEEEREVVVDAALAVVQVGVAHAAGLHAHECFARSGVGHDDRFHRHRLPLAGGDDSAYLVRHG
jgi:hypothetical protein